MAANREMATVTAAAIALRSDSARAAGAMLDWHFGQFLLPLAVLELYFRARDAADARARLAMAGGLFAITIMTGIGIFLVATNSWLARL
jgi:hypothetical protein